MAAASPASLRRALESFDAGPEAKGLRYGVVFAPVAAPDEAAAKAPAPHAADVTVRAHGELPLTPASLAKLPSTAFALEALGTDFTFCTRVLAAGTQRGDTLHGDLVVIGGGDPFLVSERLWLLAREVRATGLTAVKGRLWVDGSWLSPDNVDPARARDREVSDRPYAARLSALAVNFNAAAVRIGPGPRAGAAAVVDPDPIPGSYLRVDNRLVTGPAASAEQLAIRMLPVDGGGEVMQLEGTLPLGAAARVEYRSVSDPLAFSASMVRAFLGQAGVAVSGPTVFAPAPAGSRPLVEFPSLPLRELVAKANRHSNNFMADQIALGLSAFVAPGADSSAGPQSDSVSNTKNTDSAADDRPAGAASLTRAGQWIAGRLRETCGAGAETRLLDGSGLNPGNRLTAATLARLLSRAWTDLRVGPDFAASLAVPGQEGTLRSRFKDGDPPAIRGKTGTLSEPVVSGFAGYLEAGPGRIIAFVILMNAPADAGWDLARMKARQETWIREFLR